MVFVRFLKTVSDGADVTFCGRTRRRRNLFATNNNNIKQENTILKLPEKQKAIYAGRQHC